MIFVIALMLATIAVELVCVAISIADVSDAIREFKHVFFNASSK